MQSPDHLQNCIFIDDMERIPALQTQEKGDQQEERQLETSE
ncbi:MAG: hypothetical protein NTW95_00195 [Candidatus Aminicenantes bacterium]|nr:hypothetical protein [Candidatus Aminicenantes bacterium]